MARDQRLLRLIDVFRGHDVDSRVIGKAVADPQRLIKIPDLGLVGKRDKFYKE